MGEIWYRRHRSTFVLLVCLLAVLNLASCEHGAPQPSVPQQQGPQTERLKLPYPRDAAVYWTGGPHMQSNSPDFAGTYSVGKGSGLDFSNGGNFNVLAMASGRVVEVNTQDGKFGCSVTIESPSIEGYPDGIRLKYAHLDPNSREFRVLLDRFNRSNTFWVQQGTILGQAGNSGGQSTIHLHVELADSRGNPLEWGDGKLLVDGYRIYNYWVNEAGTEAYNYDGSAVRLAPGEDPQLLNASSFSYIDSNGQMRTPARVRVHPGFACKDPKKNCENPTNQINNDEGRTKFALVQRTYGFLPDTVSADAFSTPSTPVAIGPETPVIGSSTVLVFDTSGSMADLDQTGVTKLEAAIKAAINVLNVIAAENQDPLGARSQAGLVDFNETAQIRAPLSTDTAPALSALQQLYAVGGTGMPDGLRMAIDQLYVDTSGGKQIIILLTDGMPNIGLGGNYSNSADEVKQQVLELATRAGQRGICIYTVGFGIPGAIGLFSGEASIDEDFLRQVSASSGCGAYYNAQNAMDLAKVYLEIRHSSTGTILFQQSGQIAQDQELSIGTADVPDNQAQLLMTLNWPGSELIPILQDPDGENVDTTYPGAQISSADTIASIIVNLPKPGRWQIAVYGSDVPTGITSYYAALSVRPSGDAPDLALSEVNQLISSNEPISLDTTGPSAGIPVLLIILVVAVGSLSILYIHKTSHVRRPTERSYVLPKAQLVGIEGELRGQAFPIQRVPFLIGRGLACDLRLSEASVSRKHARVHYSQGSWFVQDMNSRHGTFVNGQRVTATRLKSGDRIAIGGTILLFHLDSG